MNHRELFGQDLNGWKLTIAYYLELKHGLMGLFPAVFSANIEEMFICLDKDLLLEIGKLLPPRLCRVVEFKALANEELGIAFDLEIITQKEYPFEKPKDTELPIVDRKKFTELLANAPDGKCPFKWAPGLVSNDMNAEEFVETLKLALAKAS